MKRIFLFLFLFVFSIPFIKIDKSLFVIVYNKDNDFLVFPVAVGDNQTETKEGVFKITGKSINPKWFIDNKIYPPYLENKENALGIRWIGLSWIGYGIHGTNDPLSIGKDVSQGCVRLQNEDVEILYEKVNINDEVLIYSSQIDKDLSKSVSLLLNFYDLKKFIIRESK
ncbi:MAG: L,D-transpeptidase [Caldisericia bacterium]